jgi:hypothetical protein
MKAKGSALALACGLGFASMAAHADLILLSPVDFGGSGLGSVSTILTLQASGRSTTESASVGWNGSADVITGDAKTGASQTQTRTLGNLGVTSADTLRVIFNANESANDLSISLDSLVLNLYAPDGTLLFSSGPASQFFSNVEQGTGNSGFVFGLNASQAAAAQTSAFAGAFQNNRVGLSASLTQASDGVETFFVANAPAVPEPATLAFLAPGMLAMFGVARRKQRRTR